MITFKLSNNVEVPAVGLGTWRSTNKDAYNAVLHALKEGYRHIDTAAVYGNERAVGEAIKDSGLKREEIFVTTKLWNADQGYKSALEAAEESLKKLGLEYVDLYLIHWFKGYDKMKDSWKAMEELYKQGKVRAIGVSNFNVHHLMGLLEVAKVKPVVNQVETHVKLQNEFLRDYCEQNGIRLTAYAPLMSNKVNELLEDDTLNEIAKKYNKTVPQVAIRWLVERGIIVIPKSITPSRISANFDVFDFELNEEDMQKIKGLNAGMKMFPEMDNVVF